MSREIKIVEKSETKKIKYFDLSRYVIFVGFILIIFLIFIIRLFDWQIINYEYYRNRANSSSIYFINTEPVRGEILDKNGIGLAVNNTGYKVFIDRLHVNKNQENNLLIKIVNLLENNEENWINILPICFDNNTQEFNFIENKESQVNLLRKNLSLHENCSAQDCVNFMISKYIGENNSELYTNKEKYIICSIKYNMDKNGILYYKSVPYMISDSISKNTAMIVMENYGDLTGIRVQSSMTRAYINGDLAPHIVGYTGLMSPEEFEEKKENYCIDEKIGKSGVEKIFENYLHGKGGKRTVQISKTGEIVEILEKEKAISGNTVHLTISSELQKIANESLKNNIEKIKKSGVRDCESGAVVVLDTRDFSVLAASTYPSYDLNKFMENKSYYSELVNNKFVPLLNRAFSGAYAPGSIYKPLTACAALEEQKLSPDELIPCYGSFNFYTGYKLRCMGIHRNTDLVNALAKSCNVFFAELGRRLGAELLAQWARKFGLGVKTGLELSESVGILAGPEYSKKVGSKWYESGSSQAAIGQSDNMFTPLQLATYTATIANNGIRHKTHILDKITDYSRNNIIKNHEPEILETINISQENLNLVKQGMRQVVLSGTARDFANFPIPIAAKTGTAQNSGSDHTTFICYGPYENPEIAIAVVIEHGVSGMASKNVARDILNTYFNLK